MTGKPKQSTIGRPTKCTPQVVAKICEALQLGVSWAAAAAHAGISEACIKEWLQRGRAGEKPFADFVAQATQARDRAEVRMAAIVARAAEEGSVLAAQWWLERRRGDTWGKTQEHIITTPEADGVRRVLERLTGDEGSSHGK